MAQLAQPGIGLVGNTKKATKPRIRGRRWCFTWNNYPIDTFERTLTEAFDKANYIYQEEKGANGTPHLQGYVEWTHPRDLNSLKGVSELIHWEPSNNRDASIKYCSKEETRAGRLFTNIQLPKKPFKDPRPWQAECLAYIATEPDDRKIRWYVDEKGGQGKTALCKHIIQTNKSALYLSGSAKDMKYAIKAWIEEHSRFTIALLDITRSTENFFSYQGLEEIKNGIFFNTKYESGMVTYDPPHVIVFANFKPDESKLSADRWDIKPL